MGQTAKISASISLTKTASPDGGVARADQELLSLLDLVNGTASGQADCGFIDKARSIAESTNDDIDVLGGLTDALGQTVSAVEIVAIYVKNVGTRTVTLGGATHELQGPFAAAGDKITLRAGETFLVMSDTGWAAASGASDDFRIANGATGGAALVDVGFIGRTA